MKIAYLIAAHTDATQLSRLLTSLNGGDKSTSYFFIHIDKRVDIKPFKEKVRQNNVIFISKRIATHWGAYSQCRYQQNLMEACLSFGVIFDRVFFLSGLDYPLWSNARIEEYLEANPDKELIKGMNLTECCDPPKMQTRVKLYHYRDWSFGNNTVRRALYGGLRELLHLLHIQKKNYIDCDNVRYDIYCGSSWWCLTYSCMKYVYDVMTSNKALKRYFKSALAPDELFVQTIIFNSSYASKAILYKGEYPGLVGLTPLHYIEYGKSIAVYTEKDYDKLISSGKMFFRKAQTGVSDALLDMIDKHREEELLNKKPN